MKETIRKTRRQQAEGRAGQTNPRAISFPKHKNGVILLGYVFWTCQASAPDMAKATLSSLIHTHNQVNYNSYRSFPTTSLPSSTKIKTTNFALNKHY
jgi:hypothetical protein